MHKLVLIRHGESTWNLENLFTGWTDVGLTPLCRAQAQQAGRPDRAKPYGEAQVRGWNEALAPAITIRNRGVVAAHRDTLRALVKYLDNINDDDVVGLNISNAIPLVYELDKNLHPIRHYYLSHAGVAAHATTAMAAQGSSSKLFCH